MVAELVSCRTYAKRRGVSPNAVSAAIKAGHLKASVSRDEFGQPKINDVFLADAEWAANVDEMKAPAATRAKAGALAADNAAKLAAAGLTPPKVQGAGVVEEVESAAALKHWQAQLAELKYRTAAGELVQASTIERKIVDVFSACKSRLLALPSRAKQALPELTVEQIAALDSLVRECCEELAIGEDEDGEESAASDAGEDAGDAVEPGSVPDRGLPDVRDSAGESLVT